jgi:hypothetical protein
MISTGLLFFGLGTLALLFSRFDLAGFFLHKTTHFLIHAHFRVWVGNIALA